MYNYFLRCAGGHAAVVSMLEHVARSAGEATVALQERQHPALLQPLEGAAPDAASMHAAAADARAELCGASG